MQRIPILPNTLLLLGSDPAKEFSEIPFNWEEPIHSGLPKNIKKFYNRIQQRTIDLKYVGDFYYEKDRFNPFKIESNFKKAMRLLEECYSIKDDLNSQIVVIRELKNQIANSRKLLEIEVAELKVRKEIKRVGNASSLVVNKELGNVSIGEYDHSSLHDFLLQKLKLKQDEINRQEALLLDINEPNNPQVLLHRLTALYNERLMELSNTIDCLKHGMFIFFSDPPPVIHPDLKDALNKYTYELLREEFISAVLSGQEPPQPQVEEQDNPLDKIDIEFNIRNYLWSTSKKLQKFNKNRTERIIPISLKSLGEASFPKLDTDYLFAYFRLSDEQFGLNGIDRSKNVRYYWHN